MIDPTETWREERIDWDEALHRVPSEDYLETDDLDSWEARLEAVERICELLESGLWLSWEAVIREEQQLALADAHEAVLDELLNFGDEDDRILYIDDWARPRTLWHEDVRRVAPTLIVREHRTDHPVHHEVLEAVDRLLRCLRDHSSELELPEGASSLADALGASTWHCLNVQGAMAALSGVGEAWDEEVVSLENAPELVDRFLSELYARAESVAALDLTLEALLEIVILPDTDHATLVRETCARLGLEGPSAPLALGLK